MAITICTCSDQCMLTHRSVTCFNIMYKVYLPLTQVKAAIEAVHRRQIETKWTECWAAELEGKELRAWAPTSAKTLQLPKRVKKVESELITQMRTGKIGLCAFSYRRKSTENSRCEYGQSAAYPIDVPRLTKETWREMSSAKKRFGNVDPPFVRQESCTFH